MILPHPKGEFALETAADGAVELRWLKRRYGQRCSLVLTQRQRLEAAEILLSEPAGEVSVLALLARVAWPGARRVCYGLQLAILRGGSR